MFNTLKQVVMAGIILGGLAILGTTVNYLLTPIWTIMTVALALARRLLMLSNFIWDINGAFGLYFWIGIDLGLLVAWYAYKAYLFVASFFRN
ncbi:MAG: hypothetical protein WC453_02115 [Patescibacteria group bacterium]